MNDLQRYAYEHPLSLARALDAGHFGNLGGGYAIALSVNK